jgi:predicted transcriptional regulator
VVSVPKAKAKQKSTALAVIRDEAGRILRLGIMQRLLIDILFNDPRNLAEIAQIVKEPEQTVRTRLRQLAQKGVVTVEKDGLWSLRPELKEENSRWRL